jgi:hypothetical protein
MGFVFEKLSTGKTVSSYGQFVFKKLITNSSDPGSGGSGLDETGILDLRALKLPSGTYTITVKATATGLDESEHSNSLSCVIKY